MKLISAIIPNYNCGRFLDRCLQHLVRQTHDHLEIIICDDASTDNSLEVIKKWIAKDARIRLLQNEVNLGAVKTYNRCYFEAKGDFVMVQDADDWSELTRAEKQVAAIEEHGVGLCVTNHINHFPVLPPNTQDHGTSRIIDIYSEEVWGATPTLMFKKKILSIIPGYPLYFDRMAGFDRYFIMDILDRYKGYYLNEPLYNWLTHPVSDHRSININEPRYPVKMISNDIYLELKRQRKETGTDWVKDNDLAALKDFENKLINDKNLIADKLRMFACIQIDYHNFDNAKILLREAFKRSPGWIKNYKSLIYYFREKYFNKK